MGWGDPTTTPNAPPRKDPGKTPFYDINPIQYLDQNSFKIELLNILFSFDLMENFS